MRELVGKTAKIVLAYLVWIAVSALSAAGLLVARACWLAVLRSASLSRSIVQFSDRTLLIFGGIGILAFMIASEPYLVKGVETHRFARRASRIAGIELVFVGACLLVTEVLAGALAAPARILALEAGMCALGTALLAFSWRTPRRRSG
jgi:hypothetical protein